VRLRAATEADADLLLSWRNEPDAVRYSRGGRPVNQAEHRAWLRQRLADPSTRLWIGEESRTPVGQVRVDRRDDEWLVSIAVAPEARGRGVARALLAALQTEMSASAASGRLMAEVHRDNTASTRAFAAAGFEAVDVSDEFRRYDWAWGAAANEDGGVA
jgi:RimJ/RimL family protein N-acetyltransferase